MFFFFFFNKYLRACVRRTAIYGQLRNIVENAIFVIFPVENRRAEKEKTLYRDYADLLMIV